MLLHMSVWGHALRSSLRRKFLERRVGSGAAALVAVFPIIISLAASSLPHVAFVAVDQLSKGWPINKTGNSTKSKYVAVYSGLPVSENWWVVSGVWWVVRGAWCVVSENVSFWPWVNCKSLLDISNFHHNNRKDNECPCIKRHEASQYNLENHKNCTTGH